MSHKHVLAEAEYIYEQLFLLLKLVDKFNREGNALIKLEFENSYSITFHITNLCNYFTSHAKYPYSYKGAKMACVGLEHYYNQIFKDL